MAVRERIIAGYLRRKIKQAGGKIDKIQGEGVSGIPDQLIAYGGSLYLVETKKPKGSVLSGMQKWQIRQYEKREVQVHVIGTKEQADEFIKFITGA